EEGLNDAQVILETGVGADKHRRIGPEIGFRGGDGRLRRLRGNHCFIYPYRQHQIG
ncbi:hypothetical protein EVAR_101390_1, partial [Eumeta japonica]